MFKLQNFECLAVSMPRINQLIKLKENIFTLHALCYAFRYTPFVACLTLSDSWHQRSVVRKPINANPGLRVNLTENFISLV